MPRLSKIGAAALAAFGWTGLQSVSVSYLVVAGGAGGPGSGGAGGGAGGLLTGTASLSTGTTYTVTVGAGGATGNPATAGGNSVFSTATAIGGGPGGWGGQGAGTAGGSGGGGAWLDPNPSSGGAGTSGQGNAGGTGYYNVTGNPDAGAGGGGAGAVGGNASNAQGGVGGAGSASSISGSSVTYAGGGGGAANVTGSGGAGGTGGGGAGGNSGSTNGTAGTPNLGGGGGGGPSGRSGGAGGSGIVIISYVGAQKFGGGVVTSVGGNTIHTFTTSGTLVPITPLTASALVVAGGGGGGRLRGGGGGAGGLRTSTTLAIDTNSTYLVTVGAGGAGSTLTTAKGSNGTDSVFYSITSTGGGGGGSAIGTASSAILAGANGGSGGGGAADSSTGATFGAGGSGNTPSTSPSQGSNGGSGIGTTNFGGGGGGGASAVGATGLTSGGGAGGAGTASSLSGTSTTYAGGGGGGGQSAGGAAGTGGGGAGASGSSAGSNGTANTGGGGGGDGNPGTNGGTGGSGIVIISYAGSTQLMAGGTVAIIGGNVIHTFTSSGYLTPIKYVSNSLRFRSSATANLTRTFVAGDRTKFTWSGWVKRGSLTGNQNLFGPYTNSTGSGTYGVLRFVDGAIEAFDYTNGTSNWYMATTSQYRDPAAWYHIQLAVDTTQSTSSDRVKIYINGVQLTAFTTATYPSASYQGQWNNALVNYIGYTPVASQYFDGYLAEVNYVDGQALTPNSFGTLNSYGVWQPITYGGSYGTNGFYLPFSNTTSTTTLGYDFSPNGNNWTTTNISLTAGTTYDSMTDAPTLTSATAANYPTWNPLKRTTNNFAITNANLQASDSSTTNAYVFASMFLPPTGKFYWEVTNVAGSGLNCAIGACLESAAQAGGSPSTTGFYRSNGQIQNIAGTNVTSGNSYTAGDVIGIAVDVDNGTVQFYKNGVAQGATPSFTFTAGTVLAPFGSGDNSAGTKTFAINFGQQPFAYTVPTGFVRLNTYNL